MTQHNTVPARGCCAPSVSHVFAKEHARRLGWRCHHGTMRMKGDDLAIGCAARRPLMLQTTRMYEVRKKRPHTVDRPGVTTGVVRLTTRTASCGVRGCRPFRARGRAEQPRGGQKPPSGIPGGGEWTCPPPPVTPPTPPRRTCQNMHTHLCLRMPPAVTRVFVPVASRHSTTVLTDAVITSCTCGNRARVVCCAANSVEDAGF